MFKALLCTVLLAAAVAVGAVGGWTIHTATRQTPAHTLMGACVRGVTFGIDTHTYVCRHATR